MYRSRDWRREQKLRRKEKCLRRYEAAKEDHEATRWHMGFRTSYGEDYWNRELRHAMRFEGKSHQQRDHNDRRCCECGQHGACDWCLRGRMRCARQQEESLDNDLRDYMAGVCPVVEEGEVAVNAVILHLARPFKPEAER